MVIKACVIDIDLSSLRIVMNRTDGKSDGFTLLELLVALSIFALISVSLYGSLSSMLDTKEHLEKQSEQLREIQTAFRIIGRDIEQSVDRPIRTAYEQLPAMRWAEHPGEFEFTTGGRRNPLLLKRSSLQRVAYRLEDGELIKDSWPVLDRDVDSKPFSQVILRGVESFELSFKDDKDTTYRVWPPANIYGVTVAPLPKAVQVHLDVENWGRIDRLFLAVG
jgi:general secretion pathway protein J